MKAAPPAKAPIMPVDVERMPAASPREIESLFLSLLSHHSVASKEWAIRRYDHEVLGATRTGPFAGSMQGGPGDAAVLKPLESRGPEAAKGGAVPAGYCPGCTPGAVEIQRPVTRQ